MTVRSKARERVCLALLGAYLVAFSAALLVDVYLHVPWLSAMLAAMALVFIAGSVSVWKGWLP